MDNEENTEVNLILHIDWDSCEDVSSDEPSKTSKYKSYAKCCKKTYTNKSLIDCPKCDYSLYWRTEKI